MYAPLGDDGESLKISTRNITKYLARRFCASATGVRANAVHYEAFGIWLTYPFMSLLPSVSMRRGTPHIFFGVADFPARAPSIHDPSAPIIPEFFDVMRVNPTYPSDFRVMCNIAGDWLSPGVLSMCIGEPIRLAANPLSWLKLISRGEDAVCWIGPAKKMERFAEAMSYHPRVVCDSAAHAAEVYKNMRYEKPKKFADVSYETNEVQNVERDRKKA